MKEGPADSQQQGKGPMDPDCWPGLGTLPVPWASNIVRTKYGASRILEVSREHFVKLYYCPTTKKNFIDQQCA